jgi:hypothetical protein
LVLLLLLLLLLPPLLLLRHLAGTTHHFPGRLFTVQKVQGRPDDRLTGC